MKKVVTVCPYCASGCKISTVVDNSKIVGLKRAGKPTRYLVSEGLLWLNFINDTQIRTPRLKTPMIRRQRGGQTGIRFTG